MSDKPEKSELNRREFLFSSSAAAIAAVTPLTMDGEAAAAETQAFRSAAGSLIPYNKSELMTHSRTQRAFTGPQLAQVAFPLGGIGSGTVSLGGRGQLCDWEIFNRPGKGRVLPFSFVAARICPEGESAKVKVVEASLLPPFTGGGGYKRDSAEGLPRMRGAHFTGDYPFAGIAFEDDELPVEISLEAFNPFIPLNVDDSSLPVAVFQYQLRSRSNKAIDASLAFSLLNPIGYDGKAAIEGTRYSGFGRNITEFRRNGQEAGDGFNGLHMSSTKYSREAPEYGTVALLTDAPDATALTSWAAGDWFDPFQKWYDAFAATGEFHDSGASQPSPDGRSNYATLAPRVRLLPGETKTITFFLAWYFPTRINYWNEEKEVHGKQLHNYYGTRFAGAWEVAQHTAGRIGELRENTRAFQQAFFSSTVPGYVLEAVSSQAAILRTNTCLLLEGKQFFAFEGCDDYEGCCPMNCTHVWNYEQALAFLFPELERSMRHTDFTYNMRADGSMTFRTLIPLGLAQWSFAPAADGQMGCIMKLYREWQISGDDAFLRQLWPQAKRALEYAWSGWDTNRDGIMEGEQQTTYDNAFFGPNSMTASLYLGALRAGELMATAVGDETAAESYKRVREKGVRKLEELWNGEYYIQKIPPASEIRPLPGYGDKNWYSETIENGQIRYQYGAGCLSDQLLGSWFAQVIGIDPGWSQEHQRTALKSIYRYNFMHNFYDHPNMQRIYALNDEKGLLLCSWPKGNRPPLPFVYSDEVWTGIEYQVAAHLIYEGMVAEGLSIVKGICDRYDGVRRNPWNEVECGSHYSRALASWSVLLALSGYRYSAKDSTISFMPAINDSDFQAFFTANSGWGTLRQKLTKGAVDFSLHLLDGELPLQYLTLRKESGERSGSVSAGISPGGSTLTSCRVTSGEKAWHIDLGPGTNLKAGQTLAVRVAMSRA